MPYAVGMSPKDYQEYLKKKGSYAGVIDGIEGPKTRSATTQHLKQNASSVKSSLLSASVYAKKRLGVCQLAFAELGFYTDNIDGIMGPNTRYAIEQYQNHLRDISRDESAVEPISNNWPRQKDMRYFYGAPGTNHTLVNLPYPFRLAWDLDTVVTRTTINKNCSESFLRVMNNVLSIYGMDEIKRLRLDVYGGCYNNRKMRGGSSLSTHAYACALDFDPERNRLRWGANRAEFAKPAYNKWWDCWEAEGWVSLGRERNFDFMHVQAARL